MQMSFSHLMKALAGCRLVENGRSQFSDGVCVARLLEFPHAGQDCVTLRELLLERRDCKHEYDMEDT